MTLLLSFICMHLNFVLTIIPKMESRAPGLGWSNAAEQRKGVTGPKKACGLDRINRAYFEVFGFDYLEFYLFIFFLLLC